MAANRFFHKPNMQMVHRISVIIHKNYLLWPSFTWCVHFILDHQRTCECVILSRAFRSCFFFFLFCSHKYVARGCMLCTRAFIFTFPFPLLSSTLSSLLLLLTFHNFTDKLAVCDAVVSWFNFTNDGSQTCCTPMPTSKFHIFILLSRFRLYHLPY